MTITLFFFTACCYGNTQRFQDSYQQGMNLGKKHQGGAVDALHADPKSIYKNYTDHPQEMDYFKSNRKNDDNLNSAIKQEFNTNDVAQTIKKNHPNRPKFEIQKNSPSMNMNRWILDNGYQLTHEKSCKQIPSCQTVYDKIKCFEVPKSISHRCGQRLEVDVKQTVDEKHYPITVHLKSSRHYMAAIIDLTNGRVIDHGPRDSYASIQGLVPATVDCHTLSGVVTSTALSGNLTAIGFPSCGGLSLNVRIENPSSKHRAYGSLIIDIMSRRVDTAVSDRWINTCTSDDTHAECSLDGEHCTQGLETRVINGVSVTRDCWAKEASYTCKVSSSVADTCQPLRKQGCEQIGSLCTQTQENQCTLYNQTFRCPREDCTYQTLCTDIPTCINGDCSQHEKTPDPDFNQAVGSFGALIDAARLMDKSTLSIFAGRAMSCSKAPIGYLNCCGDGGWGEVLNDKCDQKEKELKNLREKHLTVRIPGEYCGHEVAGVCLSYRKRFCVFPTKIARLIQEGGRFAQLKRDFGSPEEPKCDGITPEDLQKIDFSKIDFSEVADDLKNAFPIRDQAALIDKMNKDIQERASEQDAN